MWEPTDVTALPTIHDRINANLAIQTLEIHLKDAISQLVDAQLRVDAIERNLRERKAWITPIRRLSLDALSLIFEFCGEDDWETALRIAAVSRQWRAIALSTPRAWSFIDLKECDDLETIQIFFQRSGQRPLHIFLPDYEHLTFLSSIAHRLQCLSIDKLNYDINGLFFPILTRLTIRSDDGKDTVRLSDLGVAHFPALLHLVCESTLVRETLAIGDTSDTVAPLQHVSLAMTHDLAWLDLLKLCKDTLVSLSLLLLYRPTTSGITVELPKLKHLHIQYWDEVPDLWPLNMVTAALKIYQERREDLNTVVVHQDVKNVTVARFNQTPNLSIFLKLVTLQLEDELDLSDVVSQLLLEDRLCPELTLIKVAAHPRLGNFDDRLTEVNRHRQSGEGIITPGPLTPLTGIMTASPCGKGMPCSEATF